MNVLANLLVFVVLPLLWAGTGWQLCTSRHRQRGMEVDKFYDRPNPLGGLTVPAEWSTKVDA